MLYLLYGTKNYLIKEEIKKITKNFDDLNISKFDLANDDIKTVIDDCMTISLFDDKKIVLYLIPGSSIMFAIFSTCK